MAAIHATKGKGGEKGVFRGSGKNCDWLVRSLECGLPNEVDLCINCLLIMSSEEETNGREGLLAQDVPHLLSVLLAHVGVFSSGKERGREREREREWKEGQQKRMKRKITE